MFGQPMKGFLGFAPKQDEASGAFTCPADGGSRCTLAHHLGLECESRFLQFIEDVLIVEGIASEQIGGEKIPKRQKIKAGDEEGNQQYRGITADRAER